MRLPYIIAGHAAHAAAALLPEGTGKLRRTFNARRGLLQRVRLQSSAVRDHARPLVWFHAPSVGEGLQALPIIRALQHDFPEVQLAYTHFSPSAEKFAGSVGVDISSYLPFDTAANADVMLDALAPSCIVFSKLDVWPILVERAARRQIPVLLISGTVAPRSARLGWWARSLTRGGFAELSAVGAIDEANAQRLLELGVRPSRMHITGDTRFDQVRLRADAVDRTSALLTSLASPRFTVVAGSTWPADEAVLLPAFAALLSHNGEPSAELRPRLIIAAHEPTESHLAPIERWARQSGVGAVRLADVAKHPNADVVIVDRVGVLGELYALSDVAFVGGGFHSAGLHSVIEPAAFGVPVLFGPQHHMSREAGLLLEDGAAVVVTDTTAVTEQLGALVANEAQRLEMGARARRRVDRELGATQRSLKLIREFLPPGGSTSRG